jgi:hypothetical protein
VRRMWLTKDESGTFTAFDFAFDLEWAAALARGVLVAEVDGSSSMTTVSTRREGVTVG